MSWAATFHGGKKKAVRKSDNHIAEVASPTGFEPVLPA
jgi:hypothetical protein